MPTYEYKCNECDHSFDAVQRMSDDKLTKCPECGKDTLTKVITAHAFHLKGEGWYETDFKHKK